jgi:histidinol-phosphate aminotransferase
VADLDPQHGGPDALGVPAWDFSTNANACGPAPLALAAVRAADVSRYPDPSGAQLRSALARLHGVAPDRIVLAASASEFIGRLSTAVALTFPGATVQIPAVAYGDYAHAALALGLRVRRGPGPAAAGAGAAQVAAMHAELPRLLWHTEPGSPLGQSEPPPSVPPGALLVIDCAYAPLRLQGAAPALPAHAWQLWSPNKALGLTGVRGAYAIAPELDSMAASLNMLARLQALAPSWPLGAQGVAMLSSWAEPATQTWVRQSLATLRDWKERQLALCAELGWQGQPSVTPFFVARWPTGGATDTDPAEAIARAAVLRITLSRLRQLGLKLRDTTSMGLPGWVRLSVQPPEAQDALARLWRQVTGEHAVAPSPGPAAAYHHVKDRIPT